MFAHPPFLTSPTPTPSPDAWSLGGGPHMQAFLSPPVPPSRSFPGGASPFSKKKSVKEAAFPEQPTLALCVCVCASEGCVCICVCREETIAHSIRVFSCLKGHDHKREEHTQGSRWGVQPPVELREGWSVLGRESSQFYSTVQGQGDCRCPGLGGLISVAFGEVGRTLGLPSVKNRSSPGRSATRFFLLHVVFLLSCSREMFRSNPWRKF